MVSKKQVTFEWNNGCDYLSTQDSIPFVIKKVAHYKKD